MAFCLFLGPELKQVHQKLLGVQKIILALEPLRLDDSICSQAGRLTNLAKVAHNFDHQKAMCLLLARWTTLRCCDMEDFFRLAKLIYEAR